MGNSISELEDGRGRGDRHLYDDDDDDGDDDTVGDYSPNSKSATSSSASSISLNSSYSIRNSKSPLILDSPSSPIFSRSNSANNQMFTANIANNNNNNNKNPNSSNSSSNSNSNSNGSFTAEYHLEHSIDVDNDTIAGICLRYDVDKRESINSVHATSRIITGDGGLNDLFHIQSLHVPVQLKNVANVISYLERSQASADNNNNSNNNNTTSISDTTVVDDSAEGSEDEELNILYSDEFVTLILAPRSAIDTDSNELILKQFYAPNMTDRNIKYSNIVQFDWINTDALRGKFTIGMNAFKLEFASKIQQSMKHKHVTITNGFLVYEKDRVMPTFFTTRNNQLFFEKMSEILISLGVQARSQIGTAFR